MRFLLLLACLGGVSAAAQSPRVLRIPKHATAPAIPACVGAGTCSALFMDSTCDAMRVATAEGWAECPVLDSQASKTGENIPAGTCLDVTESMPAVARGDHCCVSADEFLNGLIMECVVPAQGGIVTVRVCNPYSVTKTLPTTEFNITLVKVKK